ncbi:MAG: hypothetical protein WEB88_17840 [Gemmatimonadota bacterium]
MTTTSPVTAADPGAPHLRRLLLIVLILGILGTGIELVLLGHYEDLSQWVPIVLLAAGLAAAVAALALPRRGVLLALRAVMAACILGGLLGLWLHYTGNMEFELEMYPDMQGLALMWATLRGATPALAPGTMVQIGLFGLLATYRHPGLRRVAQ